VIDHSNASTAFTVTIAVVVSLAILSAVSTRVIVMPPKISRSTESLDLQVIEVVINAANAKPKMLTGSCGKRTYLVTVSQTVTLWYRQKSKTPIRTARLLGSPRVGAILSPFDSLPYCA
jgi:hypothetical protein